MKLTRGLVGELKVDITNSDEAELNRLAYGRTTNAAEEATAEAARRELEERARAKAAAQLVADVPEPNESELIEPDQADHPLESETRRAFPARMVVALLAVALLALGVGIGLGHSNLLRPGAARTHTPTPNPKPTPAEIELTAPDMGSSLFARKQVPGDITPMFGFPNPEFRASSVRLVFTWSGVGSVFIAQAASRADGICLLLESDGTGGDAEGIVDCAPLQKFATRGLSASLGDFQHFKAKWTTTGISVSARPFN